MKQVKFAKRSGFSSAWRFGLLFLGLAILPPAVGADYPARTVAQRDFDQGRFAEAAATWQHALERQRAEGDTQGEIDTSLLLARAHHALGQHQSAVQVLEAALSQTRGATNDAATALLKSRLGAALTMVHESDRAWTLLQDALGAARRVHNVRLEGEILNDLGNLQLAQQRFQEALVYYQAAATLARENNNIALAGQALVNAAAASARTSDDVQAAELNGEALRNIDSLPVSYAKGFLLLTAGQTDRQVKTQSPERAQQLALRAHSSFQCTLQVAGQLGNLSLESYALGYLAELYEQDGQRTAALELTRRAAYVAQQGQLSHALYRWEWQQGRLLRRDGNHRAALEAYRRAVETLEPLRADLSSGYGNAAAHQSFRETQGPLFFELADLLLLAAGSAASTEEEQALLREARDTVERMKTVELDDYFCDDCVDLQRSKTLELEKVDERTAVVYLVPLPTRTEVLVGLSSGLKRFVVEVGAEELASQVAAFRQNLETRTTFAYRTQAQQLYDWLIRPIRPWLRQHEIDTLVFVPDGALRTIPFASLHDGKQFLIQDLAVAVAPGLSLVAPRGIAQRKMRLLLSGLSKGVQGFPPLDFVPTELSSLETMYPGQTLANERFTLAELRKKLQEEQYSIVHIASHGQFDRDVRNTFVLTYDTKLTLNVLESLIRPNQYRGRPVELLVLSACQTAAGDDRAALGLAGVAVKAGARSALASLWFVNDQSTSALISEVYQELRRSPSLSKARALQAAQLKLLGDRRYRHPCYWAPFLVIGNWL